MNAMEKGKSEAAKRCITMTVATPRANQPALAAPQEEFAPAPTATETPAPTVEAAEPEPKVVQQKKEEPTVTPKGNVTSILTEWDDE
jgi:hypothetical protein